MGGALLGLAVGSFIATVAVRWPSGELPLAGRSRCDRCGAPVAPRDNLPLLSYALLRGRARCCGGRIDPLHPIAEASAAIIGAVAGGLPLASGVAAACFGWLLLTLALIDARVMKLPRMIVAMLAGTGVIASIAPPPGLLPSVIGMAAGYASLESVRLAYRVLRGRDGLGAGDAGMLAAIGAWTGWRPLPVVLLIAALLGLAWAGAMRLAGHRVDGSLRLPLGTLMAVAAWPVWLAIVAPVG